MFHVKNLLKTTLFGFGIVSLLGFSHMDSYAAGPELEIQLPDTVTLMNGTESEITIDLSGDITDRKRILLSAASVVMTQEGKESVTVEVVMENNDYYSYDDVLNGASDVVRIKTDNLTAGEWTGELVIDVNLHPEIPELIKKEDYGNPFLNCPDTNVKREYIKSLTFSDNTDGHTLDDENCWDVSTWQEGNILAWYTGDQTNGYDIVIASDNGMRYPKNSSYFFSNLGKNTNGVHLDNYHFPKTKDVTNISDLFNGIKIAEDFVYDLSFPKAESIDYLFSGATFKESFTWGDNISFPNLRSSRNVFSNVSVMESFDIANLDTSGSEDFYGFFNYANLPDGEYVFDFDTSKGKNMAYMFAYMQRYQPDSSTPKYITSVTLGPKFSTENVVGTYKYVDKNNPEKTNSSSGAHSEYYTSSYYYGSMENMFEGCNIKSLSLGESFDTSNVQCMNYMFYRANINNLDFGSNFNCENVKSMYNMFYMYNDDNKSFAEGEYCILTLPDNFNAKSCLNMDGMFYTWDTSSRRKVYNLGANFGGQSCKDMSNMFRGNYNTILNLGDGFYTDSCKYMDNMFYEFGYGEYYYSATNPFTDYFTLDLGEHFNTESCQTIDRMFYRCRRVNDFNIGAHFNCKNVLYAEKAFNEFGYYGLKQFIIPDNFNLIKVTSGKEMFRYVGYENLEVFRLGENFGGDEILNAYYMFSGIGYSSANMQEVNLGSLTLPKCTDITYAFSHIGYNTLEHFRIPDNINLCSAKTVSGAFNSIGYESLKTFHCGNNLNLSSATYVRNLFAYSGAHTLEIFDFGDNANMKSATSLCGLLASCGTGSTPTLKELYFGKNFNAEGVTDASWLFGITNVTDEENNIHWNNSNSNSITGYYEDGKGLMAIEIIDLGDNFNLKSATDTSFMFAGCGYLSLEKLNLGENFNAESVINARNMFAGCGLLKMTDFSLGNNPNFKNTTNMSYMFNDFGRKIEILTLPNTFFVNSAQNMSYMFSDIKNLKQLNLPDNFNTSNATNMAYMFSCLGWEYMEELILPDSFDTSNVINMAEMFFSCGHNNLRKLHLGDNFSLSSIVIQHEDGISPNGIDGMFQCAGYETLEELYLGPNFAVSQSIMDSLHYEEDGITLCPCSRVLDYLISHGTENYPCNGYYVATPKIIVKDEETKEGLRNYLFTDDQINYHFIYLNDGTDDISGGDVSDGNAPDENISGGDAPGTDEPGSDNPSGDVSGGDASGEGISGGDTPNGDVSDGNSMALFIISPLQKRIKFIV